MRLPEGCLHHLWAIKASAVPDLWLNSFSAVADRSSGPPTGFVRDLGGSVYGVFARHGQDSARFSPAPALACGQGRETLSGAPGSLILNHYGAALHHGNALNGCKARCGALSGQNRSAWSDFAGSGPAGRYGAYGGGRGDRHECTGLVRQRSEGGGRRSGAVGLERSGGPDLWRGRTCTSSRLPSARLRRCRRSPASLSAACAARQS